MLTGACNPIHAFRSASTLAATVSAAEQRYNAERAAAEVGWNTWLSGDMLTHALLPSGLAVSIALHVGNATVADLGARGPSCDAATFPAMCGNFGGKKTTFFIPFLIPFQKFLDIVLMPVTLYVRCGMLYLTPTLTLAGR